MLTIIIPVLDQAAILEDSLKALQPLKARGHEILVADGGSRDGSVTIARKHASRVILSGTGRALQMNAGSESASHDILLFLPVTTRLPDNADAMIIEAIQQKAALWGFFDVQYNNPSLLSRMQAGLSNWQSSVTDHATVDQGIFVHRHTFERVKGFDNLPEEDIALCKKLLGIQSPARLVAPVLLMSRK